MELRGWKYTGRNIGQKLHRQYQILVDCLDAVSFVNNRTWGNGLQKSLAAKMGINSAGQVRTVKRICEDFGFFAASILKRNQVPPSPLPLTHLGALVYNAARVEKSALENPALSGAEKAAALENIKTLYAEIYCDVLKLYHYVNEDGSRLLPLRATLKALDRYGSLDKWEWYLFNTRITRDDDLAQEAAFDRDIRLYRAGQLSFSMKDVKENPKGHQYLPQYFAFSGLAKVTVYPRWRMEISARHEDVKAEVLAPDYLSRVYG